MNSKTAKLMTETMTIGTIIGTIATLGILMNSVSAKADLVIPPEQAVQMETLNIAGSDASELWDKLNVLTQRGSTLATESTTYKIWRANSGLSQIICETKTFRITNKPTESNCRIEKSKDEKIKLPSFHIPIRLG